MDHNNAMQYLTTNGYTCVLWRGEESTSSRERGVRPLLTLLDSGKSYAGFCAADKVVGRATAFLYCLLQVRAVHAGVLSDSAARILEANGIAYTWSTRVPGIRNRTDTGPCPMEQATQNITDPAEALIAIRTRLRELAE